MPPPLKVIRPRRRVFKRTLARQLRAESTDAERKLWSRLRNKQLGGVKFRRQHPIGPFVVDFYCSNARLVIELDGSQHRDITGAQYDERRSRWLSEQGYRVLRFPNADVFKNLAGVMEGIWLALKESGMPLPEIRFAMLANFDPPSRGELYT
jgi:very-short-patch-repair endonuclease